MNINKTYIYSIASIIVLAIIVIGYASGYRLTTSLSIKKSGTVTIHIPLENTTVFFDNRLAFTSKKNDETTQLTVSPNTKQIIVSKVNYFPWTKNVQMNSGGNVTYYPILVSQNPSGEIINQSDPEYWKIKNDIKKITLPTKQSPLTIPDGTIRIWVENNTILSEENGVLKTLITPEYTIKNISLYKDRSDVIIFSAGTGVYALETDTDNFQNFMPIYRGQDPHFIPNTVHSVYIEDNATLMMVAI
jgi:hypothetical protein